MLLPFLRTIGISLIIAIGLWALPVSPAGGI